MAFDEAEPRRLPSENSPWLLLKTLPQMVSSQTEGLSAGPSAGFSTSPSLAPQLQQKPLGRATFPPSHLETAALTSLPPHPRILSMLTNVAARAFSSAATAWNALPHSPLHLNSNPVLASLPHYHHGPFPFPLLLWACIVCRAQHSVKVISVHARD